MSRRKETLDAPLQQRLGSHALALIPALFLCLALQGPIFALLDLPFDPLVQGAQMGLFLAAWALLSWGRYNLLATLVILPLGGLYAYLSGRLGTWAQIKAFFSELPQKIHLALEPRLAAADAGFADLSELEWAQHWASWRRLLVLAVLVLIALLAYLIAARLRFPLLAAGLVFALALACVYFDRQKHSLYLFFVFPALSLLMSAPEPGRRFMEGQPNIAAQFRRLLLALLLAALAFPSALLLARQTPERGLHNAYLYWLVDDAFALLPPEWKKPRPIELFSLAQVGYYPQELRLGGPVSLSPEPLLRLNGRTAALLRSQARYEYDGQSWQPSPATESWRFGSAFAQGEREAAFARRPLLEAVGGLSAFVRESDCEASFLRNRQQALFAPAGVTEIALRGVEGEVLFTADGLLYASRLLPADSRYHFKAETPETERIAAALQAAGLTPKLPEPSAVQGNAQLRAALQLPKLDTWQPGGVMDAYAHLIGEGRIRPGEDDRGLALTLLQEEQNRRSESAAEAGEENPLRQALLLQKYLQAGQYTLEPEWPPDDVDFVESFISYERDTRLEGYCVYYATAMTMMARSLGIPARYVEGLALSPEQSREAAQAESVLTGKDAHAWCELYFEGLGWLSFDPTPGGGRGENSPDAPTSPESVEAQPSPTPTPPVETTTPSQPHLSEPPAMPTPSATTKPPIAPSGSTNKWPWALALILLLLVSLPVSAFALLRRYWQILEDWPGLARRLREGSEPFGLKRWLRFRGRASHWFRGEKLAEGLGACLLRCYGREIRALLQWPKPALLEEAAGAAHETLPQELLSKLERLDADLEALSFGPPRLPDAAAYQNAARLIAELRVRALERGGTLSYYLRRVRAQFL